MRAAASVCLMLVLTACAAHPTPKPIIVMGPLVDTHRAPEKRQRAERPPADSEVLDRLERIEKRLDDLQNRLKRPRTPPR